MMCVEASTSTSTNKGLMRRGKSAKSTTKSSINNKVVKREDRVNMRKA